MCKQTKTRYGALVSFLSVAALILATAGPLAADVIYVQIDAQSGSESASYTWALPKDLDANGHMSWTSSSPVVLGGANGIIATVDQMSLEFYGDPGVSLGFSVTAGSSATTLTITSAVVSFASVPNLLGYASAGITLTDTDSNGGWVNGLFPDSQAYEARYNAANTVFAQIVDPIVAPPEMTVVTSERSPGFGRTQILVDVDSIQSQFYFNLSPNDQASGTSRFDVIPEPATVGLVAIACGLLFAKNKMRKRK